MMAPAILRVNNVLDHQANGAGDCSQLLPGRFLQVPILVIWRGLGGAAPYRVLGNGGTARQTASARQ